MIQTRYRHGVIASAEGEKPVRSFQILRFPRTDPRKYFTWGEIPRFDPSLVNVTEWVIDLFVAEGFIQLLYGERGCFKSTFLAFASRAVAVGKRFLGRQTRPRRVLFLDYENPASVIKARNDHFKLNLPRNENLVFWDRFQTQIPSPGDPIWEGIIRDCIRTTGKPPWLIFDSFSSLLKTGEGGEFTGQIAPLYLQFRKLTDLGASVTIIDHTKKGDPKTLYGGKDKEAKADSIHRFTVRKSRSRTHSLVVEVESWLKRSAPEGEGSFAFEVQTGRDDNGHSRILDIVPAEMSFRETLNDHVELLCNLIRDNPALGQQALAQLAAQRGLPREHAVSLLKEGEGTHWQIIRLSHNKCRFKLI